MPPDNFHDSASKCAVLGLFKTQAPNEILTKQLIYHIPECAATVQLHDITENTF